MFHLAHEQDIARLTLSRPEARNAIPAAGWADLSGVVEEASQSAAKVLIVYGTGAAFCAGADLGDFAAMGEDAAARTSFRLAMREALDRLASLEMPTLAAVDGPCFGAGVALAMACDLRIAGPGASFAITPAKFGISYPQEDIGRLVGLVGPGQAARLLLGAGSVDAAEAARIGLVEILAADSAREEAERLACAIVAGSPASHRALKRGVRLAAAGMASDERQDRDFDDLLGSGELAQRLAAAKRR
ncbi:MAG: enoyl-CoA hydratase/isomerase family protein [Alphaproteobacteria bacterium]|nr:enoyl-CoA hydratase/isomerase family protein [Alphaproteobacteria bacterium]